MGYGDAGYLATPGCVTPRSRARTHVSEQLMSRVSAPSTQPAVRRPYRRDRPHGRLLTPTLDKMVTEGMAFSEAYAGAPVCAWAHSRIWG